MTHTNLLYSKHLNVSKCSCTFTSYYYIQFLYRHRWTVTSAAHIVRISYMDIKITVWIYTILYAYLYLIILLFLQRRYIRFTIGRRYIWRPTEHLVRIMRRVQKSFGASAGEESVSSSS